MQHRLSQKLFFITLFFVLTISGCVLPTQRATRPVPLATRYASWQRTLTPDHASDVLPTPDQNQNTGQPTPVPEFDPTPEAAPKVYLHPGLPETLVTDLTIPSAQLTESEQEANIRISIGKPGQDQAVNPLATWIYVLAAPFYTTTDSVETDALMSLWRGEQGNLPFSEILLTDEVYAAFQELFGPATDSTVEVVSKDQLLQLALSDQPFITLVPFENLRPQWKVLRVDGLAPIDDAFTADNYPLSLEVWVEGNLDEPFSSLPATNYDSAKRTVLLMTGVTALTRATAHLMEIQGNTYPGKDILPWFSAADLVHISNEVAFAQNCPPPDPVQPDLIFCSSPDRIELLEYVSTDIIELTGNHLLDYGVPAMNLTLEMYAERGWTTFAGGWDLDDARSPALITHNGNKLAFLGCNPVGPPIVWATNSQPGSAPCGDLQWMADQIIDLKNAGYLPIVTFQYAEDYTAYPSAKMEADFQFVADAGAVMVSGSQAHTPKTMIFHNGSFIHYGLGNLFFDQMEVYYGDILMQGTREGFIDRLVFYDGQLVSVELLTTMLEDYARPRPMSTAERDALLARIFALAVENNE